MKRILLLLVIFCCALPPLVFSLDLEVIGGLGNLAYDKSRTEALSAVDGTFNPQLFPLALVRLSGEHNGLAYNTGYERDPLLWNRLFANVKTEMRYFSIEMGPFFGISNSFKLPLNPGVSTVLELGIPGTVFIKTGGSSTLGIIIMDKRGNYSQYTGDISVGFWVPHVICSLNMSVRNHSFREHGDILVEDELRRYFLRADVYTKNVPYTIKVDLGYQNLMRSYTTQSFNGINIVKNTDADEFKSVFVGMEGTYTLNPALKFLLGGEMPVYYWGVQPMKKPSKGTMLFEARAGVVWTFDK